MQRFVVEFDAKTLDILALIGERYNMTLSEANRAVVALVINLADRECKRDKERARREKNQHNNR